jgi:hypothetical protein
LGPEYEYEYEYEHQDRSAWIPTMPEDRPPSRPPPRRTAGEEADVIAPAAGVAR